MLHYIYSRSLITIILFMILMLIVWATLSMRIFTKRWQWTNLFLSFLSLAAILYTTLLCRSEGSNSLVLQPFAALAAARVQPEFYREMLMNMLLFFPLGLALSHVLPSRLPVWARVCITGLAGCVLSVGVEALQYRFALGTAETDDVICNTLGTLIGAASLPLSHLIQSCRERFRKHDPDHN